MACNSKVIIMRRDYRINHPRQNGSVLIIGLVMLLLITFIGISAISTSKLEMKMANNDRSRQLAMQAAEAALREGEQVAASTNAASLASDTCSGGYCTTRGGYVAGSVARINTSRSADWCDAADGYIPERWQSGCGGTSLEVWTTAGRSFEYSGTAIPDVVQAPRYIIEYIQDVDCYDAPVDSFGCQLFRITALGYGSSTNNPIMLQSVFRKG